MNDLRYALRVIRRFPLSNAVIVFTIALMVAAIGLLYGSFRNHRAVNLPFEDPDRLVKFWRNYQEFNLEVDLFPRTTFQEIQQRTESFEMLGAVSAGLRRGITMVGGNEPARLNAVGCTADALKATGLHPLIGRFFSPGDESAPDREVVVLSERVWRKYFDGDQEALGQSITLNNRSCVVIGVAPESLYSTYLARDADLWFADSFKKRRSLARESGDPVPDFHIVGRLKDGVDLVKAQSELDVLYPQIAANFKGSKYGPARLTTLGDNPNRAKRIGGETFVALALVACIVLIACFNMTCLYLVQATSRARELAVRQSMGAGRWRIVRQMLLESSLLAVAGGAGGMLFSFWLMKLADLRALNLTFDPLLYVIAFGGAILIGALVSILPALRSGRTDFATSLKDGGQSSATRRRHRTRNFLVVAQMVMATILTVVSVWFGRGFLGVFDEDLTFDPDKLLAITVARDARSADAALYADQALEALSNMPGVEAAAVTSSEIPKRRTTLGVRFAKERLNPGDGKRIPCNVISASPNYAKLMGQRLVRGHAISPTAEALDEALVNERFVKKYLAGEDPIGLVLTHSLSKRERVTIVGVLTDQSEQLAWKESQPEVYVSHRHMAHDAVNVLVRTKADAKSFGLALRETLQELDQNKPIGAVNVVTSLIGQRMKPLRITTLVLLGMAGFGIFMSLMGVYGVVAYAAIERTREMGIRMALGARRGNLVGLIMGEGTALIFRGVRTGGIIAFGICQCLPHEVTRHLLLSSPRDPLTYLLGLSAIVGVGAIAALVPARRMINLKPSEALRYE